MTIPAMLPPEMPFVSVSAEAAVAEGALDERLRDGVIVLMPCEENDELDDELEGLAEDDEAGLLKG